MSDEIRGVGVPLEGEADVLMMIPPDTGAREIEILDPMNDQVKLPVALYLAEKLSPEGVRASEASILYRFHPTMEQRAKILQGEDLYLMQLLPNGRAPLAIELSVGAGPYKLTDEQEGAVQKAAPIVERLQLWTPDQDAE